MLTYQEVLFKGKKRNNGEWVVGSLIQLHQDIAEIFYLKNCTKEKGTETDIVFVDPKTVCQYIGLTDKHKHRMFVGDIVRKYYLINCYNGNTNVEECFIDYIIKPITGVYGFEFTFEQLSKNKSERPSSHSFEYEIIGNIFDNPELL